MIEDITKDISREFVSRISADELEYFDELAESYFKKDRIDTDSQLGFGLVEIGNLATPAVMTVVSGILTYLMTDVIKIAKDQVNDTIKEKLKIFFSAKKKGQTDKSLLLTNDQLQKISVLMNTKLKELKIDENISLRIKDSLISSFVLER